MADLFMQNPYEQIYAAVHSQRGLTQKAHAQGIIKHLGFMYNTFGKAIKDFVKVVSHSFQNKSDPPTQTGASKRNTCFEQRSQDSKQSKDSKQTQDERRSSFFNQDKKKQKKQKKINITPDYPKINDSSFQFQNEKYQQTHQRNGVRQQQISEQSNQERSVSYFRSQFIRPERQNINKRSDESTKFDLLSYKPKQVKQQNKPPVQQQEVRQRIRSNETSQDDYASWFKSDQNVRVTGGRTKKEREKLNGISCVECQKYYRVMQIQGNIQDICNCTSRHRSNRPTKNLKQQFTQEFDL